MILAKLNNLRYVYIVRYGQQKLKILLLHNCAGHSKFIFSALLLVAKIVEIGMPTSCIYLTLKEHVISQ